jgi:hypothetical protein
MALQPIVSYPKSRAARGAYDTELTMTDSSDEWGISTNNKPKVNNWYKCWYRKDYRSHLVVQPKPKVQKYEIWQTETDKPGNRYHNYYHCDGTIFTSLEAAQMTVRMLGKNL